ncbi:MAG: hypothetical protein IT267_12070 [Saprospiraceae bacterium]|nr:hypothetical protein [Saprospiraceae bacterium]
MSSFVITNLLFNPGTNVASDEKPYKILDYTVLVKQTNLFNQLLKVNDNFICHILGNPVLKRTFSLVWSECNLQELWNDDKSIYKFFKNWNGITALLMVNKDLNQIRIITDPLGFFPIFIYEDPNGLIITNELKQFWNYNIQPLEWDFESIQAYYNNGHFISGRTWFKNCLRVLPAQRVTINADEVKINKEFYWTWSQSIPNKLNYEDTVEEYYNTFSKTFEEIDLNNKHVGVGLSGGMDSRWVAYELSKTKAQVKAFTLSEGNSIDLNIARKVSSILKMEHFKIPIQITGWYRKRLKQFWEIDGLIPLQHFHEGPIYEQLTQKFDLISTGFYGGGIYATGSYLNQRINSFLANQYLSLKKISACSDLDYFNIDSIDPYLSWQKISQCGALQVYTMSKYINVLIPFYNIDWMVFNYSIREQWQEYSKFYLKVLSRYLPEKLARSIWQKTLIPASWINSNYWIQRLKFNKILKKLFEWCGLKTSFVNYNCIHKDFQDILEILEIPDFLKAWRPETTEQKLRYSSIIIWYHMWTKRRPDVL